MKLFTVLLVLVTSNADAWWGPGPWGGGWAGPAYNGYGYGGYVYPYPPIQYPTFNYQTTVIQQAPPQEVIVREPPQVIYRDNVIYRDREVEVCNDECERMRRYFKKH